MTKQEAQIVKTTRAFTDMQGMTIREGTVLHILKELPHPTKTTTTLIILIDNGTGLKETFPKTAIEGSTEDLTTLLK